jgi:hypothetical protein
MMVRENTIRLWVSAFGTQQCQKRTLPLPTLNSASHLTLRIDMSWAAIHSLAPGLLSRACEMSGKRLMQGVTAGSSFVPQPAPRMIPRAY